MAVKYREQSFLPGVVLGALAGSIFGTFGALLGALLGLFAWPKLVSK